MASQYSFHDGMGEVVPWNARYSYPSQASRTWKTNVKIPPKNGGTFTSALNTSGTPIRFELPSQSYLNTRNTCLSFDFTLTGTTPGSHLHVQNGIQSLFKRLRIMYGSLVLEDIREYHVLVRMITEAVNQNINGVTSQCSIGEGVGGIRTYTGFTTAQFMGDGNVRVNEIQVAQPLAVDATSYAPTAIANGTRRYCVQLGLGLLQQMKLLPLKWMASQLAIEIELAPVSECISGIATDAGVSYSLNNMTLQLELLEFDGAYDAAFLEGLRGDGVPIKFSSWDTFLYTPNSSTTQNLMIPERNRSLKSIYCVQLPNKLVNSSGGYSWDSHAFLESSTGISTSGAASGTTTGNMQSFQWRIGGKYYPAQAVLGTTSSGSGNGGAEAYFEFQKAINLVGNYNHGTAINSSRWSRNNTSTCIDWSGTTDSATTSVDERSYQFGPSCYVVAADLETSDGTEVSGLNGEEQNDIALNMVYTSAQDASAFYNVYVHYDVLLILRENNIVELIK